MGTVKSAVLEKFNAPLVVREYPLPTNLEPGATLVRTEMAGICGTDVHLWKGELPIKLPVIMGHETVGRIEQLGNSWEEDWTGQPLKIGDRITWNSAISCGKCYYCAEKKQPTRCPERRAYGIGYQCDKAPHLLGGYAAYHYLRPGTTMFKLPEELPTESVVGSGCALVTAIHGVERICVETNPGAGAGQSRLDAKSALPILWRDWIVVQGAGPVGLAALAVAKAAGGSKVIVIGGPKSRLDMARRFGADHVLDMDDVKTPRGRIDAVLDLTRGYGADVVLECVGAPAAVVEGMEMCRDGGKYLILGHYCDAGTVEWNPRVVTRKQLQVFGSWSSEPRHMRTAIEFLKNNRQRYPFHELVTDRFSIDQANEALQATAKWQSTKSVIVP